MLLEKSGEITPERTKRWNQSESAQLWKCLWGSKVWCYKEQYCIGTWNVRSMSQRNHFSSVAQLCPTLCNPIDHSTPGFPVHHQLPEFTQTHVHWVSDAIQFQYSLFEAIIEIMLNWLKDKHNNQKNRTEILETDPHKRSQLTFGKGTRATEWKKDSLFNKWCWSNWISSGN